MVTGYLRWLECHFYGAVIMNCMIRLWFNSHPCHILG